MVPRHAPLAKSNATKRMPRGWWNSANPPGEKTRTRWSVLGIIFANAGQGSGHPNGRSLETTMLPLGAIARSSGLTRAGAHQGIFRFA